MIKRVLEITRYYICYEDGKKVSSLCVLLPKMAAYRRDFDKTKCVSSLVKNELLEKYS